MWLPETKNNFIDQQKFFLQIKRKIVQASEADLKYDATAAADVTKTDAPYFCNNFLHSLFSDCTVSANGLKISNANGNYAHKGFIETELILEHPQQLKLTDEKLWLDNLLNVLFMQKWKYIFLTCDRHVLSGATLRISFRRSIDDFVLISDDAGKSYKVKILEANLFVGKLTLNDGNDFTIKPSLLSLLGNYNKNVSGFYWFAKLETGQFF